MDVIGLVERSWLRRDWAPSRAVDLSKSFGYEGVEAVGRRCVVGGRGLGSIARRCPRSKV